MEIEMNLGEFITKRRKFLHMTQEQLAERIHVSKSAVAKWETNGGIPDRENLKNLSDMLNVSIETMYQIMTCMDCDVNVSPEVNITMDIIALLESYGYVITKPTDKEN